MDSKAIKEFFNHAENLEKKTRNYFENKIFYKALKFIAHTFAGITIISPLITLTLSFFFNFSSFIAVELAIILPALFSFFVISGLIIFKNEKIEQHIKKEMAQWLTDEISNPIFYKIYLISMLNNDEKFVEKFQITKVLTNMKDKVASNWLIKHFSKNLSKVYNQENHVFLNNFLESNQELLNKSNEELTLLLKKKIDKCLETLPSHNEDRKIKRLISDIFFVQEKLKTMDTPKIELFNLEKNNQTLSLKL
jgi:hypothetical protein